MPDYDANQFNPPAPLARVTVGILSRNVLNRLSILLDGPRLDWHEEKD
jgi:hypothetical protein